MFFMENIDTEQKWDMIKFLEFNVDNCDPLNSFMYKYIKELPEVGTKIVRRGARRPDTISYLLYGNTQYWWLLMLYNDIININDIRYGMTIRFPSLSSIEELYSRANSLQKTMGNS